MAKSENIYCVTRNSIWERYGAALEGSEQSLFLVLAQSGLGQAAREALEKSAIALGWKEGPSYVWVDAHVGANSTDAPADANATGASADTLTHADIFEIVEGLDPMCLVIAGAEARALVAEAYCCEVPTQGRLRLFGRDVCAFNNLDGLLESDSGKQTVWALLRATFPHA